jgi:hypothetical protein
MAQKAGVLCGHPLFLVHHLKSMTPISFELPWIELLLAIGIYTINSAFGVREAVYAVQTPRTQARVRIGSVQLFEHGAKWWLKYVIAPLIGGGGSVPAVLLLTQHFDLHLHTAQVLRKIAAGQSGSAAHAGNAPVSQTVAPPAASAPSPLADNSSQQAPQAGSSSMPAPSPAPAPTAPAIARQEAPSPHHPSFYATDLDNVRYRGTQITVRRGTLVGIHWLVDPAALKGQMHLRSAMGDRTLSDAVVGSSGYREVEVESSRTLVLTESGPTGQRFLGEIDLSVRD